MKKISSILFLMSFIFGFQINLFPQQNTPSNQLINRISLSSKVWGYVRFQSVKKTNWSKQYQKLYKEAHKIQSDDDFKEHLSKWILKNYILSKTASPNFFLIKNNIAIDAEIIFLFNDLIAPKISPEKTLYTQNKDIPDYFSEQFPNDNNFPDEAMRMMALTKTWSYFRYFYPYYEENISSWDSLFFYHIPLFKNANSEVAYHLAIQDFLSSIKDGHVSINSPVINHQLHKYKTPFRCKIMDSIAIITFIDKEENTTKYGLKPSDTILEINKKPISEMQNYWKPKIPSSNHANLLNIIEEELFSDSIPKMGLTVKRGNTFETKDISLFPKGSFTINYDTIPYKIIYDSVGWINLGVLKRGDVNKLRIDFDGLNTICIDARNYPNATVDLLCEWLLPESKPFVIFSKPNPNFFGSFATIDTIYTEYNNTSYSPKNLILLTDANSVSQTEYTLLALKTAPRVLQVGEPTGGTAGTTMLFFVPGNISIRMPVYEFRGLNEKVQNKGITPDIFVKLPLFVGEDKEEQTWMYLQKFFNDHNQGR